MLSTECIPNLNECSKSKDAQAHGGQQLMEDLSVIVINALTTTWQRIIDYVKQPVTVVRKELLPSPKEEELPSCYWSSYGTGLDDI